tara:strand:- start:1855 stop:2919 length:1065 start_codon:yes stop_codon:yes gene_type:complete
MPNMFFGRFGRRADGRTEIPDLSCFPLESDSRNFYRKWSSACSESFKSELDKINVSSNGSRQAMYDRLLGATLYYEEHAGIRNLEEEERTAADADEETKSDRGDDADEGEDRSWVQCEKCEKWRSIPSIIDANSLPDSWCCELNTWSDFNSCEIPEEDGANDEENEEITDEREEEREDEELSYLRGILDAFKKFREEMFDKKRKREQEKLLLEEERKKSKAERLSNQVHEALDLPIDKKKAAYKAATKKSSIGRFPLHTYCEQFVESTALLKTLVDIALLREHHENLEKYLNHGDKYGRTPLHYAIISQYYDVEKALKEAGACPYIPDVYEKSAEEYGLFRQPKEKKSYLDDII